MEEAERLGNAMLEEFGRVCGIEHLRVVHVNDSVGARGSRRDHHAHIGEGNVALGVFKAVVNSAFLEGVPKILETPKGENVQGVPFDTLNLKKLKRLMKKGKVEAEGRTR